MMLRTLRWAALTTGMLFVGLGVGGCGPLGLIVAGLVGFSLLGGGAAVQ